MFSQVLCIFFTLLLQRKTASFWVNRFVDEKVLNTHYDSSGRKRCTTLEIDHAIAERVTLTPFTTINDLKVDLDISYQTAVRRLHETKISHYIPARQSALTPAHLRARLIFCEENLDRDWSKVVFSDEKTFQGSQDRIMSLWRPRNERYNPRYIQEINRTRQITCGVWGYITADNLGEVVEISPRMNSFDIRRNIFAKHASSL